MSGTDESDSGSSVSDGQNQDDTILPYSFDPIIPTEARDDDDEILTDSSDSETAVEPHNDDEDTGINPEIFCTCGNCIRMPKIRECTG